jgi:hypothetical protein
VVSRNTNVFSLSNATYIVSGLKLGMAQTNEKGVSHNYLFFSACARF